MKKYSHGLYIGRFQPLHLGHIHCIKYSSNLSEKLTIGIGSANKQHTYDNPLNLSERIALLDKALKEEEITNSKHVAIEDVNNNDLWVKLVFQKAEPFSVVFSNNELVIELFREKNLEIQHIPLYKRDSYMGIKIREYASSGNPKWKKLIPNYLIPLLESFNFEERMRTIRKN